MDTSTSFLPSLSHSPNLTSFDSDKNQDSEISKNNGIESGGYKGKNRYEAHDTNRMQNRLTEDVYRPSHHLNAKESRTVDSKIVRQSRESNISQSAEIKIQTKEGDEITISLNQSLAMSRSAFHIEQGRNKITGYAESDSFESGFSVAIVGDLNEDEQKSLKNLLEKMNKVTNDFFNGDVKSAFKHAKKVGIDTTQIASFSMDLNREESVYAVAAYQQTAMPEQNISIEMLKQAREFLADTKDFMSDTQSIIGSLTEPKQTFSELFNLISRLNYEEQESVENEAQQLLTDIISNLADGLFSSKN